MYLWIARDRQGVLWLHLTQPFMTDDGFWHSGYQPAELYKDNFQEVTFENSPQEIELKLI